MVPSCENILFLILSLAKFNSIQTAATTDDHQHKVALLDVLLEKYDKTMKPNYEEGLATVVDVSMFISSLDSINVKSMDYKVIMNLNQRWVDERLRFNQTNKEYITLDSEMTSRVWIPDLFFYNEKKAAFHEVTVPNRLMRIYQNGSILYCQRISATLSCEMKLEYFPMDKQYCDIVYGSYGFTVDDLQFRWDETREMPIEVKKGIEIPEFTLQQLAYIINNVTFTYTGVFTIATVKFEFERRLGYYMIQYYIPTLLVVILSWISFYIAVEAVPARVTLGVLTVLTMTTQTSMSRSGFPKDSHIRAIDVWMAMCFIFAFTALLEFAVVNVMSRRKVSHLAKLIHESNVERKRATVDGAEKNDKSLQQVTSEPNLMIMRFDAISIAATKPKKMYRSDKARKLAQKIDHGSRVVFPVVFITFSAFYWGLYMSWRASDSIYDHLD